MLRFIGKQSLQDDLFHLRVYIIGGHVLQLMMIYWSTCFTGVHIYRMICLTGGHLLDENWFLLGVCVFGSRA